MNSRVLSHLSSKTLRQLRKQSSLMPSSCFSIAQLMKVNNLTTEASSTTTNTSLESSVNNRTSVSAEQINKLCLLSRVSIQEKSQLNKLTQDVNNIMMCLDILQQSPVNDEIQPMYSPMQFYKMRSNRWREDVASTNTSDAESIARRKNIIQSNTKDIKAGYFIAPKVK
ncbi:hypothetical protein C9374_000323 [Naegleria lovaniensis]|uniref:Glutamyl-tRNA(Gln) amidotransferase subunit C, mitochondrial n=1 Tax=Naegleria lovaniensis TaxID=51637 RepID=A0AA88KPA1_NAELO|nr:uncharacterized protein C9374_000323 [Naegleria lovaniensis]KAG2388884.1 hypothetical protein C9374_000323 [Naegleria lovaniensis]